MFPKESNILVVDDSIHMRRLISDVIYELGFRNLVTASDANEALKLVTLNYKQNNPFDIILSDLNMPGPNGIDFLKQIRSSKSFKNLPFILITTESEKKSVLDAAINGVSSYIVKPFQSKDLALKLKEAWVKTKPQKAG